MMVFRDPPHVPQTSSRFSKYLVLEKVGLWIYPTSLSFSKNPFEVLIQCCGSTWFLLLNCPGPKIFKNKNTKNTTVCTGRIWDPDSNLCFYAPWYGKTVKYPTESATLKENDPEYSNFKKLYSINMLNAWSFYSIALFCYCNLLCSYREGGQLFDAHIRRWGDQAGRVGRLSLLAECGRPRGKLS